MSAWPDKICAYEYIVKSSPITTIVRYSDFVLLCVRIHSKFSPGECIVKLYKLNCYEANYRAISLFGSDRITILLLVC